MSYYRHPSQPTIGHIYACLSDIDSQIEAMFTALNQWMNTLEGVIALPGPSAEDTEPPYCIGCDDYCDEDCPEKDLATLDKGQLADDLMRYFEAHGVIIEGFRYSKHWDRFPGVTVFVQPADFGSAAKIADNFHNFIGNYTDIPDDFPIIVSEWPTPDMSSIIPIRPGIWTQA